MRNSSQTPYVMILLGLALLGIGMVIDVAQHGIDFIIAEFRHAPWAHGLPLAGLVLVVIGTLGVRRSPSKNIGRAAGRPGSSSSER